jgi:hypothetical protein
VTLHRQRMLERVRVSLLQASHWLESMVAYPRLRAGRSELAREVIADLRAQGVHVTSVERLLGGAAPAYREAMARASEFLEECAGGEHPAWRAQAASTDLLAGELLARLPEFYLFGLNAQILSLAEQYLRVPVAYHGAVLRHSFADGHEVGPRLWHRDCEDFHVLRTVVYLNDVAEDGGPFEYIPRDRNLDARGAHGNTPMRASEKMQLLVPRSQWKRCVGPAGTVVIADSAQVFHHESLQRGKDRSVIMMGHSSRRPKERFLALSHFPVEANTTALARMVAPEHYPHVFGWRTAAPRRSPWRSGHQPSSTAAAPHCDSDQRHQAAEHQRQ